MKPLVYVAGPITSDPFGCVRQATSVFEDLRALGLVPFLPQLSVIQEMVSPLPYEEWLAYDFDVLDHCHGLIRLEGDSPGATREVDRAHALGLSVFHMKWLAADPLALASWAGTLVTHLEMTA